LRKTVFHKDMVRAGAGHPGRGGAGWLGKKENQKTRLVKPSSKTSCVKEEVGVAYLR